MQNLSDKQIAALTAALRRGLVGSRQGVRGAGYFDAALALLNKSGVAATAEDLHTFCENHEPDEVTGEVVSRFVSAIEFAERADVEGLASRLGFELRETKDGFELWADGEQIVEPNALADVAGFLKRHERSTQGAE